MTENALEGVFWFGYKCYSNSMNIKVLKLHALNKLISCNTKKIMNTKLSGLLGS